jgi:hypothetical protein
MSASKMPLVIEHPVGVFSIEIAKGCFIRWWDGGERYVVRIEMGMTLTSSSRTSTTLAREP